MPNLSRKEELELKKARLAALREERLQREAIRKKEGNDIDLRPLPTVKDVDAEKILGDLGIGVDEKLMSTQRNSVISKSKSSPLLGSGYNHTISHHGSSESQLENNPNLQFLVFRNASLSQLMQKNIQKILKL